MKPYGSDRISRIMVRVLHYYSLAVGITAVRIDFAQRRIYKSRLVSVYAVCVNVLTLITLPFAIQLSYIYSHSWPRNPLVRITDTVYTGTHFGAILLMMAFRWRRERNYEGMAREFFALDADYFDRLPVDAAIQRHFNCIFLAKFVITCGQMASTAFGMLQLSPAVDLRSSLLAVYFTSVMFILHGVIFQYSAAMWHSCKRFCLLNARLAVLQHCLQSTHTAAGHVLHGNSHTLQQLSRLAVVELQEMSQAHWRLTNLVQRVCNNYILQTLAVLLSYAMHTITFGYYALLVLDGSLNLVPTKVSIVLATFSYLVLFADFYVFYRICQDTTNAYQSTADILRSFQALPFINAQFECCCERFSLQLMQRKLHIRIGGLFNLNMQTLLVLWAFILRHTIILIQYDWENRYQQMKRYAH